MKDILIIGDSCRDIFVYCDATRLSPEAPVPVLNVLDQSENAGMAKNVYRNVRSLSNSCDIVTNDNWTTITKTRYVHHVSNHMFFRVDVEQPVQRINLEQLRLYDYRCIVVSDYNKGFLHEDDIKWITEQHPTVFIDSKKQIGSWAAKARYIKINDYEYQRSVATMSDEIKAKTIHTLGADGCKFGDTRFCTQKVEVRDVSGAGDTFLAGLVCKFVETLNIEESIHFANKCATEVVSHKGVTTI